MDDFEFGASSSANCGGDEWILMMHFDDFTDVVESLVVDRDAKMNTR